MVPASSGCHQRPLRSGIAEPGAIVSAPRVPADRRGRPARLPASCPAVRPSRRASRRCPAGSVGAPPDPRSRETPRHGPSRSPVLEASYRCASTVSHPTAAVQTSRRVTANPNRGGHRLPTHPTRGRLSATDSPGAALDEWRPRHSTVRLKIANARRAGAPPGGARGTVAC